MVVLIKDYQDI